MKPIHHTLLPLLLAFSPFAAAAAEPQPNPQAEATYKDVQDTLGSVPTFIKLFPKESVAGAWAEMKALQLSKSTALDGRTKELIGVAVASQIPCRYCAYFHESAAKANGAVDEEVREAVAVAAIDRNWSTVLNGNMTDESSFRRDADRISRNLGRTAKAPSNRESGMREAPTGQGNATGTTPPEEGLPDVVSGRATVEDVRRDVERTLGFFPSFMRSVPEASLPGFWLETRQLLLSPNTRLSAKEKALIGLAVGAQTPDRFGIYYQTKAAQAAGATEVELREAIALAGVTRHWSTLLNGLRVDEPQFQRETDDIIGRMRQQGGK